jgi:CRISPR/Cas system-associated exonuclease Cas4 (RecB family)
MAEFEALLVHNRELYAAGMATAEDAWHFNADWDMVDDWADTWVMAKLDFGVLDEDNGHAIVVDYKTGKPDYKVVEHIQQLQFYAALTALKYEWADKITAELWYVDAGTVRNAEWNREEALRFIGRFDQRAQRIYNDRFFRPNPSKMTCRYCPYSPRGTGTCPVGV